jgi:hypothetical protein
VAGVVVLTAYSRPEILEQCLNSLYAANGSPATRKVLVLQPGNPDVERLIRARLDDSTLLIQSSATGSTPTQRMMSQFWRGIEAALGEPGCDWIMSLEEDSVLSADALVFVDEMHARYGKDRHFRGVNLGSVESDESLRGTYSLLRYGLVGNAGALPRRHWARARLVASRGRLRYEPFDCHIEPFLKTGFMVTPNLSKVMNYGWVAGTHVPDEPSVRKHFERLERSWSLADTAQPYRRVDVPHSWRHDSVPFTKSQDPRYFAQLGRSLLGRLIRGVRFSGSKST